MNWLKRILFLRKHIKKGNRVIQVGFSLDRLYSDIFPISWIIGSKGKLIIVEPDPRSYFKLQKRKWMIKDNWEYVQALITNGHFSYIHLAPKSKHNHIILGDFLLKTNTTKLNDFDIPSIVILTCNGAEYDCLLSGKNLLNVGVKFIIANANIEIERLLLSYKYNLDFKKVGKQKILIADKLEEK